MVRLNIKPLSINQTFRGRLFKTKLCKDYEEELGYLLPRLYVPKGKLHLDLKFGFSSKASDWDNPVKVFVDVLQKKYGFNDKEIYSAKLIKEVVPRGKEFIEFEISPL